MVTMDVLGAFDAVLRRRLLERMAKQGWSRSLLRLIDSFFTERTARVRLEKSDDGYTPGEMRHPAGLASVPRAVYTLHYCSRTPRTSSVTPMILAFSVPAEHWRIIARRSPPISTTSSAGGTGIRWHSPPDKLEAIHLTRKLHFRNPPIRINDQMTISPITATPGQAQPALRWLGVFFDRKLTWKRHFTERSAKARTVPRHIRNLARTARGPPAAALRKATIACVLPSILYGTEAWYAGRTKPGKGPNSGEVSTKLGWHVETIDKTLALAALGVLPVYRTTPRPTLFRDSGLPSAAVALRGSKAEVRPTTPGS